ncbi:hypothetical protein I551_6325 [Mycobacterium ulcerans str. Harvey]|uniref:Uncharacterized protein n=1 Tax=Mycobacterium ulcerans str. Harvey TaxID=1299332 RepID=A0ABP3ACB0_MYCUL|nr:hypothetical protein I551_6325 [Mycobacterium ulcerans str. Harvey]
MAKGSSGKGNAIPGWSSQTGSHQLGPCSPASATTASRASRSPQPVSWSPYTAGA